VVRGRLFRQKEYAILTYYIGYYIITEKNKKNEFWSEMQVLGSELQKKGFLTGFLYENGVLLRCCGGGCCVMSIRFLSDVLSIKKSYPTDSILYFSEHFNVGVLEYNII
jgi:hypothetical protein